MVVSGALVVDSVTFVVDSLCLVVVASDVVLCCICVVLCAPPTVSEVVSPICGNVVPSSPGRVSPGTGMRGVVSVLLFLSRLRKQPVQPRTISTSASAVIAILRIFIFYHTFEISIPFLSEKEKTVRDGDCRVTDSLHHYGVSVWWLLFEQLLGRLKGCGRYGNVYLKIERSRIRLFLGFAQIILDQSVLQTAEHDG